MAFLTVCVVLLVVNTFFLDTAIVEGRSMYPTLEDGDFLILNKFHYAPEGGDIVVIKAPTDEGDKETIVKRIIATEGQSLRIEYETNLIYVDGVLLPEVYINFSEEDPMLPVEDSNLGEYTVPQGCVFVLGDNRNHSSDSRSKRFGMIASEHIIGKVIRVYET